MFCFLTCFGPKAPAWASTMAVGPLPELQSQGEAFLLRRVKSAWRSAGPCRARLQGRLPLGAGAVLGGGAVFDVWSGVSSSRFRSACLTITRSASAVHCVKALFLLGAMEQAGWHLSIASSPTVTSHSVLRFCTVCTVVALSHHARGVLPSVAACSAAIASCDREWQQVGRRRTPGLSETQRTKYSPSKCLWARLEALQVLATMQARCRKSCKLGPCATQISIDDLKYQKWCFHSCSPWKLHGFICSEVRGPAPNFVVFSAAIGAPPCDWRGWSGLPVWRSRSSKP